MDPRVTVRCGLGRNIPSCKSMGIGASLERIAYPGARHVQLIAQGSEDGGKEGVVLHTVAAEFSLDDLVEQSFGVEREGTVPRVMQRHVAPWVERHLSELESRKSGQWICFDLGLEGRQGVAWVGGDTGDVQCELIAGVRRSIGQFMFVGQHCSGCFK